MEGSVGRRPSRCSIEEVKVGSGRGVRLISGFRMRHDAGKCTQLSSAPNSNLHAVDISGRTGCTIHNDLIHQFVVALASARAYRVEHAYDEIAPTKPLGKRQHCGVA